MFKLNSSLLALAFAAAAPQAMADTVTFPGFAHGSHTVTATLITPNAPLVRTVSAGGFLTSLNGGPSFESYCVDLYQNIAFNTPYSDYTPPGTTHVFANDDAYADLGRLFANVGAATNALQEAAFQIAIWEIAYETGSVYNLAAGAATFLGGTADSSGALTLASAWLAALGSGTGYAVGVLTSQGHQDVVTAVPEPSTYLLMMMGMAGLGLVAKRRRAASPAGRSNGNVSA